MTKEQIQSLSTDILKQIAASYFWSVKNRAWAVEELNVRGLGFTQ